MLAPFWSRSSRLRLSVRALPLIAFAFCIPLFAANPDARKSSEQAVASAEALLEEALACEIYGLDEEREELLSRAEALAPELPAVKWQRGILLVDGKWTPAESVAVAPPTDSLLAEYVAKRDAAAETLPDQLALAQWCQKQKLFDQERAHLARVLKHEPNHARARARLGYVLIENEWISREEIVRALAEEAKAQASIKKHGDGLRSLIRDLQNERVAVRERALEKVRAIRDLAMIPALETLVAPEGEEATLAVLIAFSHMPEKEASLSLARFAVLSPSYKVRGEAAELLQERPFDDFVPELLLSMKGPSQTVETLLQDVAGRFVYRRLSYQERMNHADLAVQDTVYRGTSRVDLGIPNYVFLLPPISPSRLVPVDVNMAPERRKAVDDLSTRVPAAQAAEKLNEADRLDLNARIGYALEEISDQSLGTDAASWWNWWVQYNETIAIGQKPIRTQYASQIVDIPTSAQHKASVGELRVRMSSCFAAGTPVLTNRGEVAIEQMRVGDLVLSQDVESGEIAFKPVLETTVRPPAELLRVEHEKGSFRCTGGHPFWVSGEGWVHAKRLKSGMELHTLDGSVRVSDVVSDGEEETYNLIVADFANYFVSDARVLSHDNSSRQPTDAVVPGLQQK